MGGRGGSSGISSRNTSKSIADYENLRPLSDTEIKDLYYSSGQLADAAKYYKNNVEYLITVTRSMTNDSIDKCSNCGAKVDIVSGGVCPYCDSTIINSTNKFIMSKKECINQRIIK